MQQVKEPSKVIVKPGVVIVHPSKLNKDGMYLLRQLVGPECCRTEHHLRLMVRFSVRAPPPYSYHPSLSASATSRNLPGLRHEKKMDRGGGSPSRPSKKSEDS